MAKKNLFTSENQPKRKPRGESERTKWVKALQRNNQTEESFQDAIVKEAMTDKSPIAMDHILKRISPIPRQVAPMIEFDFDPKAKPHEKAMQVLSAISNAEVPPDIGSMLISSIKAFVDIEEYTDLKERIEKLEAALNGN